MVKVYVAVKRRLQPRQDGRRHETRRDLEDRAGGGHACMADGTPVDLCSIPWACLRAMNVGQILETHLGWRRKAWE